MERIFRVIKVLRLDPEGLLEMVLRDTGIKPLLEKEERKKLGNSTNKDFYPWSQRGTRRRHSPSVALATACMLGLHGQSDNGAVMVMR